MHIAAIAMDLDDTLLRDDRTISDYTLQVLRRAAAAGIHIIPSSGRMKESMFRYVKQLDCTSAFVAANGAEIYHPDGSLIEQAKLDLPLLYECIDFARQWDVYGQTYYGETFYYDVRSQWSEAYAKNTQLVPCYVEDLRAFVHAPSPKFLVMADEDTIAKMLAEANERFVGRASCTCSKTTFLEINPLGATKGLALEKVSKHLGFAMEHLLAFGDGLNDASMIEMAGCGVCMANGQEAIKAIADRICGPNTEDGVARFVEEYLEESGR